MYKQPLEGIRVIDWTQFHQGPQASAFLADLGAEVIKVEHPVAGDNQRGHNRVYGHSMQKNGVNVTFDYLNRNKKGICLNLERPAGKEAMYRLVEKADVFVENFLPRVVAKLGMDYEVLHERNPRLIYAVGSGFGTEGPDRNVGSFDALGLARSGLSMVMADADGEPGSFIPGLADEAGAMCLAWGIVTALLARERWGIGQKIESSLLRSLIAWQCSSLLKSLILGFTRGPWRRKREANPLYNLYRCKDGSWIFFALLQADRHWADFCRVIGIGQLREDPRFKDMRAREENCVALIELLDETIAERTWREWDEAIRTTAPSLLYCKVQDYDDLLQDPQVVANRLIVEAEHPTLGPVKLPAFPFALDATPARIKLPAPEHGQDTEGVLCEVCGYTWAELAKLKEDGAIP